MAAVILGGVMAAQPLTGKSLAQHTYMFAGEVTRKAYERAQPSVKHPMTTLDRQTVDVQSAGSRRHPTNRCTAL